METVEQVNEVDTSVAGVYDLEFAAKYDGEVLDTTSIKVVVAPRYAREYKNGKVVKLTSYYVNKPTQPYAVYVYDWDNGFVTATYYGLDNAVLDTATNPL